jgi:hypothetical protein
MIALAALLGFIAGFLFGKWVIDLNWRTCADQSLPIASGGKWYGAYHYDPAAAADIQTRAAQAKVAARNHGHIAE